MKNLNMYFTRQVSLWFFVSLVVIGVFVCAYYFPTSRDDFFYLRQINPGVFEEYKSAYFTGNPRIGQFVTNLVMRNVYFKSVFAVLLFFSFFIMIFLNVFRRLPTLKSFKDILALLGIMGFVSFFIYVFGEMFFYTSFSGNYTLSVVFYLFFLFVISEYYIFDRKVFRKSIWNYPVIILLGIYTGMCNEHVPPVLIGVSFLASLIYFIYKKKIPNAKILLFQFCIIVGYIILFFAPANAVKYKVLGKETEGFSFEAYFNNFMNVLNYFRFFTLELTLIFVFSFSMIIYLFFKKKISKEKVLLTLLYTVAGLLTVFIVSYSPLSGTRLLFFCNTMFFVVIFYLLYQINNNVRIVRITNFSCIAILIFLLFSGIIIYKNASDNFEEVYKTINIKNQQNHNVELQYGFNYYYPAFGMYNRRFLLDKGVEYIDSDASRDNSQEMILKNYFGIKLLSVKP